MGTGFSPSLRLFSKQYLMRVSRTQAYEKRRNRHRDRNRGRNRLLQTNNFDSDSDPDSDADICCLLSLFSEQAVQKTTYESDGAIVQRCVMIEGHPLLVEYLYDPRSGSVDIANAMTGADCNFDGRTDTAVAIIEAAATSSSRLYWILIGSSFREATNVLNADTSVFKMVSRRPSCTSSRLERSLKTS